MGNDFTCDEVAQLLERRGILPTSQRVCITRTLLEQGVHLSAEEVHRIAHGYGQRVSKATVYNTLGLLTEKGVIREVIVDPGRVFYDPNVRPHHHFYDIDTGRLTDIDADSVRVMGLPSLPDGTRLEGVDVIVRLRSAK